ncbi:hypothetical protein BDZ89DRAFT_1086931 [Hymenopellis radicata]|nr:hypothetical protein BDZ89DRAFT_1086931 [Hymenopellis radicata]
MSAEVMGQTRCSEMCCQMGVRGRCVLLTPAEPAARRRRCSLCPRGCTAFLCILGTYTPVYVQYENKYLLVSSRPVIRVPLLRTPAVWTDDLILPQMPLVGRGRVLGRSRVRLTAVGLTRQAP